MSDNENCTTLRTVRDELPRGRCPGIDRERWSAGT
jgi:hypothetical protein